MHLNRLYNEPTNAQLIKKIYYIALYYTAATCFDAITPDILPSKRSIPDADIEVNLKEGVIF